MDNFKQKNDDLLVSIGTDARRLVILLAVDVRTVIKGAISPPHRAAPLLILEVPIEAGEGAMLLALVLQKQRALLHPELLQIPATEQCSMTSLYMKQVTSKFFVVVNYQVNLMATMFSAVS
jgi:hypothetical protein